LSGGIITIIGLAGLPNDLENWSAAFQAIGSDLGRWLLVIAGLGAIATFALARFRHQDRPASARQETTSAKAPHPSPGRIYGGAAVGAAIARSADRKAAEATFVAVEAEISLASEEATEMAKTLRTEWPHITPEGALVEVALPDWREKTTDFIAGVLGPASRAAFRAAGSGENTLECLESEGHFLVGLAQKLTSGEVRVGEDEFLEARRKRRDHGAAGFLNYDHSRAPGAPPPRDMPRRFSRRDDPGDLAKRCHMLAGSLERWVQSFGVKRAVDTAALVEEMLGADPDLDPHEARRTAEARYEKRWERDYRHKYGAEAKKLFEEAWEMHEVAKDLEQLATRPLVIQFEEVPKLFDEIAESLYANAT
jgi:hypothetical protein